MSQDGSPKTPKAKKWSEGLRFAIQKVDDTLTRLPTPMLEKVMQCLSSKEQVTLRTASAQVALLVGPAIRELHLGPGVHASYSSPPSVTMAAPRSHSSKPGAGFLSHPFYMLTRLESLTVRERGYEKEYATTNTLRLLRAFLPVVALQPSLRRLEVDIFTTEACVLTLSALPSCRNLRELSVDIQQRPDKEGVRALEKAVHGCDFSSITTLDLRMHAVSPTAQAPFGLLSVYLRRPASFANLRSLKLTVTDTDLPWAELGGRLAGVGRKALENVGVEACDDLVRGGLDSSDPDFSDDEALSFGLGAFVEGACRDAPNFTSFSAHSITVYQDTLEGMLRGIAPEGGGSVRSLDLGAWIFTPLAQAMRGHRLDALTSLSLRASDGEPEWETAGVNPTTTVLMTLAQDAAICPALQRLDIEGEFGDETMITAFWSLLAMPARKISHVKLTVGTGVGHLVQGMVVAGQRYSHLISVEFKGGGLTPEAAARIIHGLTTNCEQASQLRVDLTVKTPPSLHATVEMHVAQYLDPQYNKRAFLEDPAATTGLGSVNLYLSR